MALSPIMMNLQFIIDRIGELIARNNGSQEIICGDVLLDKEHNTPDETSPSRLGRSFIY